MSRRGRPRQPLSVIEGKGRSNHITKKEAEKRKKQEERMRGKTEGIVAPEYFSPEQKEEFYSTSSKLIDLKIFSNLDTDNLVRYIDSKTEYEKVTKAMQEISNPTESEEIMKQYNDLRINRATFFNECRSAAGDLGLSISSRLSLVIPEVEEEEVSEVDRKFGNV